MKNLSTGACRKLLSVVAQTHTPSARVVQFSRHCISCDNHEITNCDWSIQTKEYRVKLWNHVPNKKKIQISLKIFNSNVLGFDDLVPNPKLKPKNHCH